MSTSRSRRSSVIYINESPTRDLFEEQSIMFDNRQRRKSSVKPRVDVIPEIEFMNCLSSAEESSDDEELMNIMTKSALPPWMREARNSLTVES